MAGGGKGGGSSKSTSTQTVTVPSYLSNEYQYGVNQSRDLYDQGAPAYYPGQTVAGFTPTQLAAQNSTIARASNGSPLVGAAQDYLTNTINGDNLNGNPYLDDLMKTYAAKANSQVNGQFNASGRLGSGSNVATASKAISDATLPYLFQNYQNERGLQQGAAGMAPALANQDYIDLSALGQVGDVQQQQNQAGINADVDRYNYTQNAPSNWLDQYLNRINQSGAGRLTTTTGEQTTKSGGGSGGLLGALGTGLSLAATLGSGGALAPLTMGLGGGLAGLGASGLGSSLMGMAASSISPLANGNKIYWN